MCGVFGWIGPAPYNSEQYLRRILSKMIHRGPDDEGVLLHDRFALGFRRLSILDLSPDGHQPMTTADGKAHIIFNGEIYNYKELAHEFRQELGTLKSRSDSEVLLNLLYLRGSAILNKLNGMFAFVFINDTTGEFLIARDRLGVKPLHYTVVKENLFFSSELSSLMEFPVPLNISKIALNQYLHLGFIPPPLTMYDRVFKLEPGTYLKGSISDPVNFTKQRWWQFSNEIDYSADKAQWVSRVDEILYDATRIRLRSDVPVGIFLSGGVDSTLVAHYSSIQTSYTKPVALTVTFSEETYNEYAIASDVAKAKGLELIPVQVNEKGLRESNKVISQCGEPFADASFINQFFISEHARKHATVFLTGDGGDEAFAGYNEYVRIFNNVNKYRVGARMLGSIYPLLNALLPTGSAQLQKFSKFSAGAANMGALIRNNFRDPMIADLLDPDWIASRELVEEPLWCCWNESAGLPLVRRMQRFDYTMYLEPDVLLKVDRATMAHSIEARSPFLDYRVVETALKIPVEYTIENSSGKHILRMLAEEHLPPSVFKAPKKGFGLPVRVWVDRDFRQKLWERINGHESVGIWNRKKLKDIIFNESSSRNTYSLVWRIWMLQLWAEKNNHSLSFESVKDRRLGSLN